MRLIQIIEPLRFYIHWLIMLLGAISGIWLGWSAGIGIGAMVTGSVHVILCVCEIGLPSAVRNKVTQRLEGFASQWVFAHLRQTAKIQFFTVVTICMLGLLLALMDPLFSRMFLAHIVLGSMMIIGGLCSLLLIAIGLFALLKRRQTRDL